MSDFDDGATVGVAELFAESDVGDGEVATDVEGVLLA